VVVQGEDPNLVRDFLGARDLVASWQVGAASPGNVAAALANLREIHDYLVQDRPP
jgi:hypothetical protein